jgi:hypothetical protein
MMISADSAIHRFHRELTVSTVLKTALIGAALFAIVVGPFIGGRFDGSIVLLLVGAVWIVLSYRSVRGSRIAADSPSLIAAGQFEAAEQRIIEALHAFSLFRTTKLLSLHHLAMLRHAQQRWGEVVKLCRALLRQRLGPARGLGKATDLILADALLELGDLRGAHESLSRLYNERLALGEALSLLLVQSDYLARIEAWDQMVQQIDTKARLAELMPAEKSALTQALLALAARNVGWEQWSDWLRRRAQLLLDPATLVARRPMLSQLWP